MIGRGPGSYSGSGKGAVERVLAMNRMLLDDEGRVGIWGLLTRDGNWQPGELFQAFFRNASGLTDEQVADIHEALSLAANPEGYISLDVANQILSIGKVHLVNHTDGTLSVARGGTGKTSFTAGQILYGALAQSSGLTWNGSNLSVTGTLNSQALNASGMGFQQVSFSAVSGTWYTIATVQGASANAMFEVWDTMHTRKGVVRFTASQAQPHNSSPEQNTNLTVFGSAAHTGEGGIDGIRIRAGQWSSYVSYLQVQATDNGTIYVAMSDNRSSGGWTLVAGTSTGDQGYQTAAYVSTNQYPGLYCSRHSLFGGDLEVGGALKGALNALNEKIINVDTPTEGTDAANKSYVDSAIRSTLQFSTSGSHFIYIGNDEYAEVVGGVKMTENRGYYTPLSGSIVGVGIQYDLFEFNDGTPITALYFEVRQGTSTILSEALDITAGSGKGFSASYSVGVKSYISNSSLSFRFRATGGDGTNMNYVNLSNVIGMVERIA